MKKFLFLIVAIVAMLSLVSCADGEGGAAAAEDGRLTMDRIVMGTNAAFPPFEFVADAGEARHQQYSGIDVAIGVRIAEALGAELHIHDAEFGGLIMDLNTGTIDFIAAAMTIRPDRMNSVHFSIPYFTAIQYIVVQADNNDVNSVEDLDGLHIGVQLGTTGEMFVQDYVNAGELLSYNLIAQGFMELMSGGIDAVVVDSVVALMFVNQYSDQLRLVRDDDAFASEHYGIAVRHEDTELLGVINEVLREMLASGEMDELFGYYSERLN
ncbi:MAG: transporter substrate-binding domain-containing protein [Defluviitaleaceae bacterium]|nr:transporter substrate-binding domain-containing protein [Defluviitaleaceae bacterium]